jgi:DNA-binding helix-hairpin-helix protein with protein kinase domain
MRELKKGTTLKTRNGKTVKVNSKLGEGGQGVVYKVDYNGKPKALKWYTQTKIRLEFYKNIENNIRKGAPSGAFLWPLDITEKESDNGNFGYVMDLRPADYKDFSQFLLAKEKFSSVTALVTTALHITSAFRSLHNSGYSYQDLNDGNFFVHPKTGDVLICDNDNVAEYGANLGITGKCRYIAPEIVLGKSLPDVNTDKFSLAVVLFLLLINNHPLEGKKAYPPCMTEEIEKRIYGAEPVFIFDPTDESNRPVPGINNNALRRWPLFPGYVRDKFIEAFSKTAFTDPDRRVIEIDWLKVFDRLRSEIYKCDCGEVYFAPPDRSIPCPACGKKAAFDMCIEIGKQKFAVHRRTRLYECNTDNESDDFFTISASVQVNGETGAAEIKNCSKKTWLVIGRDGKQRSRTAGKTVPLEKGISIVFGNTTANVV